MRRLIAVALATGLLCVAGCGRDGDPPAAPGTSSSTSMPTAPSSSAAPAEPTMPPAAYRQTKAGAIAFTRHYWDVVNYAQRVMDPAPLRALQDPHCSMCTGGVRWIAKIGKVDGQIRGGRNHVRVIDALSPDPKKRTWLVSFRVRSDAGSIVHAGSLNEHFKAGTSPGTFTLQYGAGAWRITGWRAQ